MSKPGRPEKGSLSIQTDGDYKRWRGQWFVDVVSKDGAVRRTRKVASFGSVAKVSREEAMHKFQLRMDVSKKGSALNSRKNISSKHAVSEPLARGAVAELVTCAELMRCGFEVFRNVNPTGKVDLIASPNSNSARCYRVQVKCGAVVDGVPMVALNGQRIHMDILAVVSPEGTVEFFDAGLKSMKFLRPDQDHGLM